MTIGVAGSVVMESSDAELCPALENISCKGVNVVKPAVSYAESFLPEREMRITSSKLLNFLAINYPNQKTLARGHRNPALSLCRQNSLPKSIRLLLMSL